MFLRNLILNIYVTYINLNPKKILNVLGYKIDDKGNVRSTNNQPAIVSLEPTLEGGILRIHGSSDNFFYTGDENFDMDLAFPIRVTSRFVYFQGEDDGFKINQKEFTENMLHALVEYNDVVRRELAG